MIILKVDILERDRQKSHFHDVNVEQKTIFWCLKIHKFSEKNQETASFIKHGHFKNL